MGISGRNGFMGYETYGYDAQPVPLKHFFGDILVLIFFRFSGILLFLKFSVKLKKLICF